MWYTVYLNQIKMLICTRTVRLWNYSFFGKKKGMTPSVQWCPEEVLKLRLVWRVWLPALVVAVSMLCTWCAWSLQAGWGGGRNYLLTSSWITWLLFVLRKLYLKSSCGKAKETSSWFESKRNCWFEWSTSYEGCHNVNFKKKSVTAFICSVQTV